MAELGEVALALRTDSAQFDKGMDSAEQKTSKFKGVAGATGAAVRVMGGVMTGAAVGALAQWSQAAADDEASTLRLQQAVENSGTSFDVVSKRIDERIAKGQALAFSDDETRESMSLLVAATGDVDEAMKRNALAMDLARGTGMSLTTASKLLGKVTDENVNVLARYGINVEKGSDATALFGAVQEKFGGQAETYGNTTSASIAKVKDQIGEWQESIGASLGPAAQFIALGAPMAQSMVLAGGAIGGMWPQVVKATASLWAMIPAAVAAVLPFWPLIAVVGAVGAAVLALKWAWENNLGDIQGKAQAVMGFLTGVFETFRGFFIGLWNSLPGPVQNAVALITAPIRTIIDLARTAIEWIGRVTGQRVSAAPSTSVIASHQAQQRAAHSNDNLSIQGGTVTVPVYLNGREIARAVGEDNTRRGSLLARQGLM